MNANDGETTYHPELLASPAGKMKDTHVGEKLNEAYKVFDRRTSGHTDADKLHCVLLHVRMRTNDEENDQLKLAHAYAFENVCQSDPAGHIMNFASRETRMLYPEDFERASSEHQGSDHELHACS